MPESNVNITAPFKDKPIEEFVLAVKSGTGSGNYQMGTTVSISVTPASEGMIFYECLSH